MVSLTDIGPSKGQVEVRGQMVDVNGLTAEHIVGILLAFPEVRKVLAEREADLQTLVAQFPVAVAMMIAAGTGHADETEHMDIASKLGVGEQYDLMKTIFELTFPKGLQSFLDGVRGAMDSAGVRGWDQATKSPAQSSPVSGQDDQSKIAGEAPHGN
jgi:hypothetical protein